MALSALQPTQTPLEAAFRHLRRRVQDDSCATALAAQGAKARAGKVVTITCLIDYPLGPGPAAPEPDLERRPFEDPGQETELADQFVFVDA